MALQATMVPLLQSTARSLKLTWIRLSRVLTTLITEGKIVHKGALGPVIGFNRKGVARIQKVEWTIDGSLDGSSTWPNHWFAYWINRRPSNATVTVFNSYWGTETETHDGTSVIVKKGKISEVTHADSVGIPSNGFVVYLRNAEPQLLNKFQVGRNISYEVKQKVRVDRFWDTVQEGVGAGPLLVDKGKIVLNAKADGCKDPKMLCGSGARSAVGLTRDGTMLMVASSGTLKQLAIVMKNLGCVQAMNLDGGNSSGLWFKGDYVRKPGRLISNALLGAT
jgi:hypothetical protein